MESEIAHVRRSDELHKLDSVLHDAWFSLDEISLDEANGTATVPFAAPRGRDIGRHTRGAVDRDHQWVLTVSHVSEFEVQDPDHLIGHSYARIGWSASSGRLTINSNFPGEVDFHVSELDVRLVSASDQPRQRS